MGEVLVTITEAMRQQAVRVGTAREDWHRVRGTHDRYGKRKSPEDSLRCNIEGCLGEIVGATLFGVLDQWVEVSDDYKGLPGDIAPGIQIRATTHPTGRLLLHPDDKDSDVFGLVRLFTNVADVVGWIRGVDGKRPEWWGKLTPDNDPCFAVPTRHLTHVTVRLPALV